MKLFKVLDKSGRGFGWTKMNQKELFRFIDAVAIEKRAIRDLSPGQKYLELASVYIERIK